MDFLDQIQAFEKRLDAHLIHVQELEDMIGTEGGSLQLCRMMKEIKECRLVAVTTRDQLQKLASLVTDITELFREYKEETRGPQGDFE